MRDMAAEDRTALSSIKNAARGLDATFQVGGTVKLQKQLRVAWEDLSGSLKQLTFPGRSEKLSASFATWLHSFVLSQALPGAATAIDLDKLKTDCSPAVFGRGSEEVSRPSNPLLQHRMSWSGWYGTESLGMSRKFNMSTAACTCRCMILNIVKHWHCQGIGS